MTSYLNFGLIFLLQLIICLAHSGGPLLFYSTTKDVRVLNLTRTSSKKSTSLANIRSNIAAVDFHYEKKKIFMADLDNRNIQAISYDGAEPQNKVKIISGLLTPDGLACDWFTNKIYWTDSGFKFIEVATLEGKYRRVLFWTDIEEPRAITLVPMKGFVFWTDWGEIPKIERAGMNGDPKTRKVIVDKNICWPNGLTVDYKAERIYWTDGKLLFIKVMDYNGENMATVLKVEDSYLFAITQYDTKLFWTDWKTMSIRYYDRNNSSSKPLELVRIPTDIHLMDVQVWDKERQPISPHPCSENNGGCSHLCLLSPDPPGFSCACAKGIKLINQFSCASGPENILLVAKRKYLYIIYLDSPEYSSEVIPLKDVNYSVAVDWDPVDNMIYWSDEEVNKIQRATLNGSKQETVVSSEMNDPGIAIDWISRNIYWTDTKKDRIEVMRLDKNYRKVIIVDGLVDPRAIGVAPELGWLFWSDWYEKANKIERSNLDGSARIIIVKENLGWPNGITLDLEKMKIYWCDAKLDKMEYADMDGQNRKELPIKKTVPHAFGFSLLEDYLYWTDWQTRTLERVHKETGEYELIVDEMESIMGLKAIKLGAISGWNPCKENNGNCSQLCLYRHNQTRICACEIEYELTTDKLNCAKPNAFLIFARKDKIGRISIENEVQETVIPITGIKQASSIDFDINTMRVYWSDSRLRSIWRAYLNGSDPHRIVDLGLASPAGVAVDWLGLNIYWTDPMAHRIEVSRLVGTSRKTLLWDDRYQPHSIVVDPMAGYMYWAEGTSNSIYRAAMNGKNVKLLVSTNGRVTSLAIDYDKYRLYWAEASKPPAILMSDLNGLGKKIIVEEENFKPLSLTLYNNYIYWSDELSGLSRADKTDGSGRMLYYNTSDPITNLFVHDAAKQKRSNQCAASNGGCSHLCLTLPANNSKQFTCACPNHYKLDGNKCIAPTDFMIYSLRNLAVRLVPSEEDCPEAVLPIQGLKSVRAINFDPKHNVLYWIDGKTNSIRRAELSGGKAIEVVVPSNPNIQPYDLVIDDVGRLLFWTDSFQNIINITRLDNPVPFDSLRKIEGEKPRLIAIHVTKRLLFYTDDGKKLIRMRLDGSQRLTIARAPEIKAIAVDPESHVVVWTQGHSIHICNIEGENAHTLLTESNAPNTPITQITVHSSWLYWVDRETHQIQTLELTGKSRKTLSVQAYHINDLISVKKIEHNSCASSHQKRCSHFCILNGTEPLCSCPHGQKLQKDNRSCITGPNCGEDRFTCTSNQEEKDCIPLAWRCDGQRDCSDESDELNCPLCKENEFHCHDGGQCIEISKLCDGTPNCPDRSDEKNCCKNGFQCPQTEVCLPLTIVCDGNENCADGSDEHHSVCSASLRQANKSTGTVILIVVAVVFVTAMVGIVFYCQRKKFLVSEEVTDQSEDSLSPMHPSSQNKGNLLRKGIPDVVKMSMLNDSCMSAYDRRHVTGASSSSNTNGSSVSCYPRETLNPPPSPATTAASTRGSSPSRYHPYRHYRSINQPPPPTPCSTDVCDESDYNYSSRSRYDGGPFPPPPTPRSHCQNESCPPSPSSRSSTYFSPLPPPPSPVASPRGGYDS